MAPAARTTDSTGSYAIVDPASSISLSAAGTVDSYMVTSQQSMIESQSQPGSSSTPGEVVSEGHLDPYAEATRRSVETPASGALPPRHPVGRQVPIVDSRMGTQAGSSFTPKPRQGSRHRDRAASTSVIRESSKTHSARREARSCLWSHPTIYDGNLSSYRVSRGQSSRRRCFYTPSSCFCIRVLVSFGHDFTWSGTTSWLRLGFYHTLLRGHHVGIYGTCSTERYRRCRVHHSIATCGIGYTGCRRHGALRIRSRCPREWSGFTPRSQRMGIEPARTRCTNSWGVLC